MISAEYDSSCSQDAMVQRLLNFLGPCSFQGYWFARSNVFPSLGTRRLILSLSQESKKNKGVCGTIQNIKTILLVGSKLGENIFQLFTTYKNEARRLN